MFLFISYFQLDIINNSATRIEHFKIYLNLTNQPTNPMLQPDWLMHFKHDGLEMVKTVLLLLSFHNLVLLVLPSVMQWNNWSRSMWTALVSLETFTFSCNHLLFDISTSNWHKERKMSASKDFYQNLCDSLLERRIHISAWNIFNHLWFDLSTVSNTRKISAAWTNRTVLRSS